jgi:hypothetical protein
MPLVVAKVYQTDEDTFGIGIDGQQKLLQEF